jgi:hypothetical protein
MGTNALGGTIWHRRIDGPPGYGEILEADAIRTIHAALDAGITFFDTADEYGCGRAERILGTALRRSRDRVTIATKFGNSFDEDTRTVTGEFSDAGSVVGACEASLRRLRTDVIDLYLLQLRDLAADRAAVRPGYPGIAGRSREDPLVRLEHGRPGAGPHLRRGPSLLRDRASAERAGRQPADAADL